MQEEIQMYRTTIMMPSQLKLKAQKLAATQGISLGKLIRLTLEERCASLRAAEQDPFFADQQFYTGNVPSDISIHHDDYLY